jgi:S-adenosylmethionine:tRNA ribosyltransferase-isomerase
MNNFHTSDFDFLLPPDLIAGEPARPRDSARLLHICGATRTDLGVRDLPNLLRAGDIMVFNNTRVIPSRLFGQRGEVKVEALLHKFIGGGDWLAFARPGKRLREGDQIIFTPTHAATLVEKRADGEVLLRFPFDRVGVLDLLQHHGHIPLPPYIDRPDNAADRSDYQTVYAQHDGSVAAPTAGLHFTPELLAAIDARGVERLQVTLHVGAGTFLPMKVDKIADHRMHAEWGEVTPAIANKLQIAKDEGRRVVAVGTTSMRLLETAARSGKFLPFVGETDIFITPGFQFHAVDALMTNFHLPKSTLFMLVCAFAGMANMFAAYQHAIAQRYRFFSYGDASFLERA